MSLSIKEFKLEEKTNNHHPPHKSSMSALLPFVHPEPITQDETHRLCLNPIMYPQVMDSFEIQLSKFWTHHEIDHSSDKASWKTMNEDERRYISKTLAFFANSDNAVLANINRRFYNEITIPEIHMAMTAQALFECIHVRSYNNMIDQVIEDPDEKIALFQAVKHDPVIAEKIAWISKWAGDPATPLVVCAIAQCISEGIGFSASFASMLWLRTDNKCPGICFGNVKILIDESLHVKLWALIKSLCVNKVGPEIIEQMVREFVEIEHRFVDAALPYNLKGMNKVLMKQYVCCVADSVMQQMGESPIYNVSNPFEWMENIDLLPKDNFFEKRASAYQKTTNEDEIKTKTFVNLGDGLDDM